MADIGQVPTLQRRRRRPLLAYDYLFDVVRCFNLVTLIRLAFENRTLNKAIQHTLRLVCVPRVVRLLQFTRNGVLLVKNPSGDKWKELEIATIPPPPEIFGLSRIELIFRRLFLNRKTFTQASILHFFDLCAPLLLDHGLLIDRFDCEPEKAQFLSALLLKSTTLRFSIVELETVGHGLTVNLLSRPTLLHGCVRVRVNNYVNWIYLDMEKPRSMAHWLTTPATCSDPKILFCCFYARVSDFWQQIFIELVQKNTASTTPFTLVVLYPSEHEPLELGGTLLPPQDYFDGGSLLSLELICAGRSLLNGRTLAEIFDFNGLAVSGRQTKSALQYKGGASVYGFVVRNTAVGKVSPIPLFECDPAQQKLVHVKWW